MASIRMTNDLRKLINDQAAKVFEGAVFKAQQRIDPLIHDKLFLDFYNRQLKEHMHVLPGHWRCEVNYLTATVSYNHYETQKEVTYYIFREHLKSPMVVPKVIGLVEINTTSNTITIPNNFIFSPELVEQIAKWQNKITRVEEEQTAFEKNIKTMLDRCNTLKQFFDLWPQGENLVTTEIMHKYNAANIPKKKEPIISEEVAQDLSTSLLKRTLIDK